MSVGDKPINDERKYTLTETNNWRDNNPEEIHIFLATALAEASEGRWESEIKMPYGFDSVSQIIDRYNLSPALSGGKG